ncbi:dihydrolipoamide acetyltransferase family protein [Tahibacter amnicola]|uniref:Dihydrolipoamide acetyltransferase component of pyruvate dehydrogenase complex n=1 Tax=Tahibacter amnicola TaxID=2976241 RepID=A0ABY6BIK5_9GAMM|nr:dihydrolipoamide acetyltransferase family protein [Tahibacter amnicola]UXI69193.1 2-oxo acid dehydrogenase subunit E2 [Tahibacter amnicola]
MSTTKTFFLPDLGEGLPDATIVEWAVKEGEVIRLDAPLVSMETAKAVVEVPSPFSGKVTRLHGKNGDVINTGAALVEIELDPNLPQRAEAQDTGHHHAHAPALPKGAGAPAPQQAGTNKVVASDDGGVIKTGESQPRADAGTVVGAMEASDRVVAEQAVSVGGVKAMPAVRALAKKLGVDLAGVTPTGAGGVLTMNDVKDAAKNGTARPSTAPAAAARPAAPVAAAAAPNEARTVLSATGQPMRTSPPSQSVLGQPEQLKGVRRNMARVMADAHAKVVPTTLCDDADLHAWQPGNDITVRLIRALVRACKAVPALNAWFDGDNLTRTLHGHVDVGIAVDTEEGLFVPALRNADVLDAAGLRQAINRLRDSVRNRSIPPEELKGYTISLSNFGVFAGRYATPVVVPPCVAIVAAGKLRHELVPVMGGVETHRLMPLSLTFDHRAATGGEAARFLKAMLDDLALPH